MLLTFDILQCNSLSDLFTNDEMSKATQEINFYVKI